jgi:RNA-directed DNA polymerase
MGNTVRTVGPLAAPKDRGFPPTAWHQIDWRKAERTVQNLRFRIFRATQEQRWKQVRNLTKLLLRSYANMLVSVRRITQVNRGKDTPGIDGELATTPDERATLVDTLRHYQPWKAAPVRRVYIPKANGKQRPLGIPTLRDRVMQMVVKNALEPRFEAAFEAQSYGFRPGRCCQDAIEEVYGALNNSAVGQNHYILDADIQGAFNHISQDFILHRIGPLPGRELIKQWLKAGYWEHGTLHHTTEGTPQGGVSTLLTKWQTWC